MQMSIDLVLLCRCVERQMTYIFCSSFFLSSAYHQDWREKGNVQFLCQYCRTIWVFFSLTSLCIIFLSIVFVLQKEKKTEQLVTKIVECFQRTNSKKDINKSFLIQIINITMSGRNGKIRSSFEFILFCFLVRGMKKIILNDLF
jgi:hypothetical protein